MTPYEHQYKAMEHLATCLLSHRAAVDCSDTGTGKSATALWTAKILNRRPYVVCPLAVVSSWQRTAEAIGVPLLGITHYEVMRAAKRPEFQWEIKNRRGQWHLPDDALLIFDEAHRCKGHGTLNAKMLKAAARTDARVLALSATLAVNPLELDALGHVLGWHDNHRFAFRDWCSRHGVTDGPFASEFTGGEKALLDLHRELFPARGIRVRCEEIAEFPEGVITPELIDADPAKAAEVAEVAAIFNELDLKALEDYPSPVVELMRARQRAEATKLPWLVEQVQLGLEAGRSMVVMLNFRASLAGAQQMLRAVGIEAQIVWGGIERAEIDGYIADFQANKARVILLQIDSGGVGISLHDIHHTHPREALISPGWSAVALRQALGRTRRLGGTKAVQRLVAVAKTPEEQVLRKVQSKLQNLDTVQDGDLAWSLTEQAVLDAAGIFMGS